MTTITLRTVIDRASILTILDEPEFQHDTGLATFKSDKPANDDFFAVFVYTAESRNDGTVLLRVVSTTVVRIQRYTTTRLRYQSIRVASHLPKTGLVTETLRAHFRICEENVREFLSSGLQPQPALSWIKKFPNGAGDVSSPPEFVIADPDVAELKRLLDTPDTESREADDDVEDQS